VSSRALCWVYGLIAAGALVATWSQNIRFFGEEDNGGLGGFIDGMYENAAAASISNDLLFMLLAAFVLMFIEGRRLGIRHLWVYFVGSFLIAVSVMFPLFLLARERKLASEGGTDGAPARAS
jgi:phosphoglycerol transferase MdoB-like AlkP superfamily enzyme